MKKIILIIILFLISTLLLSGEILVLKNGEIIYIKLKNISNERITFTYDNTIYHLPNNKIYYLIPDSIEENRILLSINYNDEIFHNAVLVKLSDSYITVIINENIITVNKQRVSSIELVTMDSDNRESALYPYHKRALFNDLSLYSHIIEILKNKQNKAHIITPELKELSPQKLNSMTLLDINDINFYEKFWEDLNQYLSIHIREDIWELLEIYSDKEKVIRLVYEEYIQNLSIMERNSEESQIDNKLNQIIIDMRGDFYFRAISIIIEKELLLDSIKF